MHYVCTWPVFCTTTYSAPVQCMYWYTKSYEAYMHIHRACTRALLSKYVRCLSGLICVHICLAALSLRNSYYEKVSYVLRMTISTGLAFHNTLYDLKIQFVSGDDVIFYEKNKIRKSIVYLSYNIDNFLIKTEAPLILLSFISLSSFNYLIFFFWLHRGESYEYQPYPVDVFCCASRHFCI